MPWQGGQAAPSSPTSRSQHTGAGEGLGQGPSGVPAPFSLLCLLFPICAHFPQPQGSGFPPCCRTGSSAAAEAVFILGRVKISWCLPAHSAGFGTAHPCAESIPHPPSPSPAPPEP